jgi:SAM-dependent methyltransferase
VSLVRLDPALEKAVERASAAWPALLPAEDLLGPAGFSAIANDDLLRTLIELVPIPDIGLERLLTSLRSSLLALAADASAVDARSLRFACALARQCFIGEYAFACSDAEHAEAERLAGKLTAPEVSPLAIAAVAAYRPLHSLPLDALLDRAWPDAVAALLDQQLREPREEAELRAAVPRLTAIAAGVSVEVKQQYEQNPYPRWIAAAPAGPPRAIDDYLRETFPLAPFRPLGKTSLDLLIAGCGTGQHAIETARQFNGGRALAVDLSRASLAYAARKTRALGLDIEYGEADILELGSLGRTFDVVEASGVLHHLADPLAAWELLLSLLRPGGVMNVGLYSELGRRHVVRGRAFIAEKGYAASPDGIRACRQALMASDDPLLRELTASGDFFSLSGCRDLLFHVEEHRLTLPEIAAFIAAHGLTFLGFETSTAVALHYRGKFPDDKAMTNLDQWHAFEVENPRAFAAMYQFWIQKP